MFDTLKCFIITNFVTMICTQQGKQLKTNQKRVTKLNLISCHGRRHLGSR